MMFSLYLDERKTSCGCLSGGSRATTRSPPKTSSEERRKKKYIIQLLTIENDVVSSSATVVYGVHLSLEEEIALEKGSSDDNFSRR